jgi:hypothetical protein
MSNQLDYYANADNLYLANATSGLGNMVNSLSQAIINGENATFHLENVRAKIILHYEHLNKFMNNEFAERELALKNLWGEYQDWKKIDKEIALKVMSCYLELLKKSPESGKDVDISTLPANSNPINGSIFGTGTTNPSLWRR